MHERPQDQSKLIIQKRFGLRLRELRMRLGVSQEGLAELADIDRTYVSSCERGRRNIGLENIVKLAKALNCPASELLANQ